MPRPSEAATQVEMKVALIILLLGLTGCDRNGSEARHWLPARNEIPTVNVPVSLRQKNWPGPDGSGSCCHSVIVSLLRWQGQPKAAEWYRRNHASGETPESLAQHLDAAGIAYVNGDDLAFLEWAISTCRGCGVAVLGGAHFVALVHLDANYAGLLDPNDPRRIIFVDRSVFLSEWKHSGSWATAIIYPPSPPLPLWTY
jgi:hypothetical protein